MELRTGVFERDPNKLLLDTETALSQPPVVDAQKQLLMPRIFLIRTPVI